MTVFVHGEGPYCKNLSIPSPDSTGAGAAQFATQQSHFQFLHRIPQGWSSLEADEIYGLSIPSPDSTFFETCGRSLDDMSFQFLHRIPRNPNSYVKFRLYVNLSIPSPDSTHRTAAVRVYCPLISFNSFTGFHTRHRRFAA